MPTRLFLSLAVIAACGGDDATTPMTDTDTDTDGVTDEPTDTGLTDIGLTGQFGSVVVGQYQADAEGYSNELYAVAFFQPFDPGMANAAACWWLDSLCVAAYPAVGASSPATVLYPYWWYYSKFVNAGAIIGVGGTDLVRDNYQTYYGYYDFGPVYQGKPSQLQGDGSLTLGGDLMGFEGAGVFPNTDPMVTISPDPLQRHALAPKGSVVFSWEPAPNGLPYLEAAGQIAGLDDAVGSVELSVEDLGLRAPVDVAVVTLSRVAHATLDASGNQIEAQSRSDQAFYIDYRDDEGWTPLVDGTTIADTCAAAGVLTPLAAGDYVGALGGYANDFDLAYYNDLTGYPTSGRDGVMAVVLQKGDTLTARYRQPENDANLYLLGAPCDLTNGLEGQDYEYGPNDEETLQYTATASGTHYLVVDSAFTSNGPGDFGLVLDIQ